jgi:alpha-tubulin suppressor-like RCC1 family protein
MASELLLLMGSSAPPAAYELGLNSYGVAGLNNVGGSFNVSPTLIASGINSIPLISTENMFYTDFGEIFAWGKGTSITYFSQPYQAGNIYRSSPVQLTTGGNWSYVQSIGDSYFARQSNGTLWSWGDNSSGKLGRSLPTTTVVSSPTQIGTGPADGWGYFYASIFNSVFAIKLGALFSWGNNDYGQLGHNNIIARSSPVQVGTATNWTKVVSERATTAALNSSGQLFMWGLNDYGQLGVNSTVNRSSPVQIAGSWIDIAVAYTAIADQNAADSSIVGIKSDGTAWGWGLGNGSFSFNARSSPVQIGTGPYQKVYTNGYGTFILKNSSNAFFIYGLYINCTGFSSTVEFTRDGAGKVFLSSGGTGFNRNIQSQSFSFPNFDTLSFSVFDPNPTVYFLNTSGDLYSAGNGLDGLLGTNKVFYNTYSSPEKIPPTPKSARYKKAASGAYTSIFIGKDNTLYVTGLDVTPVTPVVRSSPVQIGASVGSIWTDVWSGNSSSSFFAKRQDLFRTVWAWGDNTSGKLGLGNTALTNTPTRVLIDDFESISSGASHTLFLRNGIVFSCGLNASGQLGTLNTISRSSPVVVGSGYQKICASASSSFAIDENNILWSWGQGGSGQLGYSTGNVSSPTAVGGAGTYKDVAMTSGLPSTKAVAVDGTLWHWGSGIFGLSGDNNSLSTSSPVKVGTDTDWLSVYAAERSFLAQKTNGTLWAWGFIIIDGVQVARSSPVQISFNKTKIQSVSGSQIYNYILVAK